MIPCTKMSQETGGDEDPLDVIIIGPATPRGSVVSAKPIGILHLLDKGELDDKIVATMPNSHLENIDTIEDIETHYPGITGILETWFLNYKGKGVTSSKGFGNAETANEIIHYAMRAYKKNESEQN